MFVVVISVVVIEPCRSVVVLVTFTNFFASVVILSSLYVYSAYLQHQSLQALLVSHYLMGLRVCKYAVDIQDTADNNNKSSKLIF